MGCARAGGPDAAPDPQALGRGRHTRLKQVFVPLGLHDLRAEEEARRRKERRSSKPSRTDLAAEKRGAGPPGRSGRAAQPLPEVHPGRAAGVRQVHPASSPGSGLRRGPRRGGPGLAGQAAPAGPAAPAQLRRLPQGAQSGVSRAFLRRAGGLPGEPVPLRRAGRPHPRFLRPPPGGRRLPGLDGRPGRSLRKPRRGRPAGVRFYRGLRLQGQPVRAGLPATRLRGGGMAAPPGPAWPWPRSTRWSRRASAS